MHRILGIHRKPQDLYDHIRFTWSICGASGARYISVGLDFHSLWRQRLSRTMGQRMAQGQGRLHRDWAHL